MKQFRDFPAKVLLFGEYAVLYGADALALPINQFNGRLCMPTNDSKSVESNKVLSELHKYLVQKEFDNIFFVDLFQFELDIEKGLFFNSSIPHSYGLGSSGALCAAIYDYYSDDDLSELNLTRSLLSQIESFFHKTSSGIDPLVSLINRPVNINSQSGIKIIEYLNFPENLEIFLVDSGKQGKTVTVMDKFLSKLHSSVFRDSVLKEYIKLNSNCVNCIIDNDNVNLKKNLRLLSKLQFENFTELIAENLLEFWEIAYKSDNYYLKLCGSGGGGFYLLFNFQHSDNISIPLKSIQII